MLVSQVKKLDAIERLLYWVQEREAIRLKKEAGEPKPWTDDWILQSYRFCNVRRMDDKVSRWLLENWYEPYKDHTNMVYAAAIARFFNKPTTLEPVTDLVFREGLPDWTKIRSTIRKLKKTGSVFNAAYMVRGYDGVDKVESVINDINHLLNTKIDPNSMENTWRGINTVQGFGSFMAGQVVADLRWAVSGEWRDRMTWAPVGPGSSRGLARVLHGDEWRIADKSYFRDQHAFLEDLVRTVSVLKRQLPKSITSRLEMMDWQNVCCEISGYEKVLWGEGHKKQRYPSATSSSSKGIQCV